MMKKQKMMALMQKEQEAKIVELEEEELSEEYTSEGEYDEKRIVVSFKFFDCKQTVQANMFSFYNSLYTCLIKTGNQVA